MNQIQQRKNGKIKNEFNKFSAKSCTKLFQTIDGTTKLTILHGGVEWFSSDTFVVQTVIEGFIIGQSCVPITRTVFPWRQDRINCSKDFVSTIVPLVLDVSLNETRFHLHHQLWILTKSTVCLSAKIIISKLSNKIETKQFTYHPFSLDTFNVQSLFLEANVEQVIHFFPHHWSFWTVHIFGLVLVIAAIRYWPTSADGILHWSIDDTFISFLHQFYCHGCVVVT